MKNGNIYPKKMWALQSENLVAGSHYLSAVVEVTQTILLWYCVPYTMSDYESSSTDESYRAEDDQDDSESEDYSTLENDLYEESGDQTFGL